MKKIDVLFIICYMCIFFTFPACFLVEHISFSISADRYIDELTRNLKKTISKLEKENKQNVKIECFDDILRAKEIALNGDDSRKYCIYIDEFKIVNNYGKDCTIDIRKGDTTYKYSIKRMVRDLSNGWKHKLIDKDTVIFDDIEVGKKVSSAYNIKIDTYDMTIYLSRKTFFWGKSSWAKMLAVAITLILMAILAMIQGVYYSRRNRVREALHDAKGHIEDKNTTEATKLITWIISFLKNDDIGIGMPKHISKTSDIYSILKNYDITIDNFSSHFLYVEGDRSDVESIIYNADKNSRDHGVDAKKKANIDGDYVVVEIENKKDSSAKKRTGIGLINIRKIKDINGKVEIHDKSDTFKISLSFLISEQPKLFTLYLFGKEKVLEIKNSEDTKKDFSAFDHIIFNVTDHKSAIQVILDKNIQNKSIVLCDKYNKEMYLLHGIMLMTKESFVKKEIKCPEIICIDDQSLIEPKALHFLSFFEANRYLPILPKTTKIILDDLLQKEPEQFNSTSQERIKKLLDYGYSNITVVSGDEDEDLISFCHKNKLKFQTKAKYREAIR